MKYRVVVLAFFFSHSILLTAQNKNLLCKSTLPLSAETVSKIFIALADRSIFLLDTDSIYYVEPGICLEGEQQSGAGCHPDENYVEYLFFATKSKNKAVEKYNELLKEFKKCNPGNWYVTENDFDEIEKLKWAGDDLDSRTYKTAKQYRFTDKENYYRKGVGLFIEKQTSGHYAVLIRFEFHTPEGKKYMDILYGLKDGSIRGASTVNSTSEWETNITLEGQIRSQVWSLDYGKSKGMANAEYIFAEGRKDKKDESLTLYNELKKKLKMFKPERWFENEIKLDNNSVWQYAIGGIHSEGRHIQLFLTGDGKVYMTFILFWPPPE